MLYCYINSTRKHTRRATCCRPLSNPEHKQARRRACKSYGKLLRSLKISHISPNLFNSIQFYSESLHIFSLCFEQLQKTSKDLYSLTCWEEDHLLAFQHTLTAVECTAAALAGWPADPRPRRHAEYIEDILYI